jgi:DNA-binding response OmpR family regulator
VIIVTARSDVFDRVLGLEHGADDYVVKPFEPRELLARIRARLRTHGPDPVQRFGELHLDAANQKVTYAGIPVSLTRMELALLQFGLAHPRQVFGREELLTAVWGYAPTVASRTVDTHVRQLRAKLRPELIETVRGAGYRFCP